MMHLWLKKLPDISKEYNYVNLYLALMISLALFIPGIIHVPDIDKNNGHFKWELPKCFVKEQTGKSCPSCGLTHSIVFLYHGNIDRSIDYHPAGPVIMFVLLFQLVFRLVSILIKKKWIIWLDISQMIIVTVYIKLQYL